MYIYPNAVYGTMANPSHPVFQAVEAEFWKWLESSNPAMEYEAMYFSDEAVCNKRGAIEQAIEEMINEANEEGKAVLVRTFDFDAIFAG